MGFKDLLKNAASKATEMANDVSQKVSEGVAQVQENAAVKKEAEALYASEMNALCKKISLENANLLQSSFEEEKESLFLGLSEEQLLAFTKEFYEKILLPANSTAKSTVYMFPYITEKMITKITGTTPSFSSFEKPLVFLQDKDGQEFILTPTNLYYKTCLKEDKKYYSTGVISAQNLFDFSLVLSNELYLYTCNGVVLGSISSSTLIETDYITLTNYFESIKAKDFIITDEEIDSIIRKKIGNDLYNKIKQYTVNQDEKLIYFAWGLDSLFAKDYIICTTEQIMIMNRELIGVSTNIKQFYYEDITSMTTIQNRGEDALFAKLLTAAFKQCDLAIYVAGTTEKINTLNKIEAERVIKIYHTYRKIMKDSAKTVQTVMTETAVQQTEDPIAQLEKLALLKDKGIIDQEEFNQKKLELLSRI